MEHPLNPWAATPFMPRKDSFRSCQLHLTKQILGQRQDPKSAE